MVDKMKCCANCEHWYPYNENEVDRLGECAEGECRRYPPNAPVIDHYGNADLVSIADIYVQTIKGTVMMNGPFTFAGEWCGEFKLMEEPRWPEEDEE